MTWVLAALLLLCLAWGPLVLVVAAGLLGVPRLRWWVQDHLRPTRRGTARVLGVVAVVTAAVVVVPDGWLPLPPAPGVLASPSYVGRPATATPVGAAKVEPHPHLAAPGRDPAHDPRGGRTSPWAGPLGLQPEVDTAWFGLDHCAVPAFDSHDRMIVTCESRSGLDLHVIDPSTMRKLTSRDLPDPEDGRCASPSYVDAQDRVVLATADRQVVALRTADGRGDPDLSVDQEWDLRPYVPHGDCVAALLPDWTGRLWWASRAGLVGTLAPESGEVRVHDLGEDVAGSFAVDPSGGVHVASEAGVHRLVAAADGTPQPAWRTPYDRGDDVGGPSAVPGTTPVLLDGGVVAVAASGGDLASVLFLDAETGAEVCRQPVFEEDDATAGGALAAVGTGVIVTNQHGYDGLADTVLGFATTPGIARVDVADRECRLRWTSDRVAPSARATVSLATGLVHTYTKRPSWLGVSAWYSTALDVRSGRAMWSVRAGTGAMLGDAGSSVVIGPDGSLWTGTRGGLVRVRDRERD